MSEQTLEDGNIFLPADSLVKICCCLKCCQCLSICLTGTGLQDAPEDPVAWWIAEECGTSKAISAIALTSYPTLAPCTSHASKFCYCCQIMAMQNHEISLILAFAEVSVRWERMSGEQVGEKMCLGGAHYVLCRRKWGVVQFCGCVLSPNQSAWMVFA